MPRVGRARNGSEKLLDARVTRALRQLGFLVSRFQQPRRSGITAGVPDLFVAHRRTGGFWVELKTPSGRLSSAQEEWIRAHEEAGVKTIVVRSVLDLLRRLRELGFPIVE